MTRSAGFHVRLWWPVVMSLAIPIGVQIVFFNGRYDVSGHAAGHLSSATAPFAAFAIVAILLYATPRARSQVLVLGASAMWLLSTVLVLIGNLRVVDALIAAGMGDTPSSELVESPTIDAAHDLANLAPWLGVVTALGLIGTLWRGRHITNRVATGAAVLSVIFPPWIFPGAGVLVVTIARCIAMGTRVHPPQTARSAEVDDVAGVEAVGDAALVEHEQATIREHVESSTDHR